MLGMLAATAVAIGLTAYSAYYLVHLPSVEIGWRFADYAAKGIGAFVGLIFILAEF